MAFVFGVTRFDDNQPISDTEELRLYLSHIEHLSGKTVAGAVHVKELVANDGLKSTVYFVDDPDCTMDVYSHIFLVNPQYHAAENTEEISEILKDNTFTMGRTLASIVVLLEGGDYQRHYELKNGNGVSEYAIDVERTREFFSSIEPVK